MTKVRYIVFIVFLSVLLVFGATVCQADEVWVLTIDGVINPVASRYLTNYIKRAERSGVECLIVEMDTPGGLLTSTRDITKAILNANVPIVIYISPRGAQSASAGVFITIAAHFAAMSPGTNIGAAHPVNLGGGGLFGSKPDSAQTETMMDKVTNDAVAYIRSLAKERGRNEEWVEEAVRKSISVTETEAVQENVVDLVAKNLNELLDFLDGKSASTPAGEIFINTAEAVVIYKPMGFHHRILNVISDPNIAYLLLILGFYGILFELRNPGSILPGVLGGIFLILAFFSFFLFLLLCMILFLVHFFLQILSLSLLCLLEPASKIIF